MTTLFLFINRANCCFVYLREKNLRKLTTVARIEIYGIFSSCETCILAKITKTISRSPINLTMQKIDEFHIDHVAPINPTGYKKSICF